MKTKRQTRKGRPAPAQVPPADDSLFRADLKKMEENNLEFFGKKKGAGKPPASRPDSADEAALNSKRHWDHIPDDGDD